MCRSVRLRRERTRCPSLHICSPAVVRRVCGAGQVVVAGARSSPGSHPAGRRYHRNHHHTTAPPRPSTSHAGRPGCKRGLGMSPSNRTGDALTNRQYTDHPGRADVPGHTADDGRESPRLPQPITTSSPPIRSFARGRVAPARPTRSSLARLRPAVRRRLTAAQRAPRPTLERGRVSLARVSCRRRDGSRPVADGSSLDGYPRRARGSRERFADPGRTVA